MRNFDDLFKEAQFYIEVDRKIPAGNTLKNWFDNLPTEEKDILSNGIVDMVARISESLEVVAEMLLEAFGNFALALSSIDFGFT